MKKGGGMNEHSIFICITFHFHNFYFIFSIFKCGVIKGAEKFEVSLVLSGA